MLTPDDFKHALPGVPEAEIDRVINNVMAMAVRFAPAIKTPAFLANDSKVAAVRAIVSKAVVYEIKSGNGTVSQESAGAFSHTINSQMPQSSLYFSPQQIAELKSLGAVSIPQGFYSVPLSVAPDGVW